MAATAEQKAQVQRMCALSVSDTTYTDTVIGGYVERYPLLDAQGQSPWVWDHSVIPPKKAVNSGWIPTYDLHAAAADIWEEKAAQLAAAFDFSADGANFSRSQAYEQSMKQVRYHRSRRSPTSGTLVKWPEETTDQLGYIVNLPERM